MSGDAVTLMFGVAQEWERRAKIAEAKVDAALAAVEGLQEQERRIRALHSGHHWCANEARDGIFTYDDELPCPTTKAINA